MIRAVGSCLVAWFCLTRFQAAAQSPFPANMREFLQHRSVHLMASAVDPGGNVYIAGYVSGIPFPASEGALRGTYPENGVGQFVVKIGGNGSRVDYATLVGGSSGTILDLSVDASGAAYVVGRAYSQDFPVTPGAYRSEGGAGFIQKLAPDGRSLLSASYIDALPYRVFVQGGDVFLAGGGAGEDFSTTPRAFQRTPQGGDDGFIMRLAPDLTSARYSTRLGGRFADAVRALFVDSSGAAFVGGVAGFSAEGESQFPVQGQAPAGGWERGNVFITLVSPDGSFLISSQLFFARLVDQIAVDNRGAIYVSGLPDLGVPYTRGAYFWRAGRFVAKVERGRSDFTWAAHVPGRTDDSLQLSALKVGDDGQVFVWDESARQIEISADAPRPCGVPQSPNRFALELSPDGSRRVFSTYLHFPIALDGTDLWSVSDDPSRILERKPLRGDDVTGVRCVAHAGTFEGGPVAPGEIITVFGNRIGPEQPQTLKLNSQGEVGRELGGVKLYFNGVIAPLLYVSSNQINAVVPFEVASWQRTSVDVIKDDVILPQAFADVTGARPGLFHVGEGWSILNEDGTLNTDSNPANPGSIVSIFMTGGGSMTPAAKTGTIGEGKTALQRTVRGGVTWVSGFRLLPGGPVEVLYAGDAPGAVQGLVQINLRLPSAQHPAGYSPRTELSLRDDVRGDSVQWTVPIAIR